MINRRDLLKISAGFPFILPFTYKVQENQIPEWVKVVRAYKRVLIISSDHPESEKVMQNIVRQSCPNFADYEVFDSPFRPGVFSCKDFLLDLNYNYKIPKIYFGDEDPRFCDNYGYKIKTDPKMVIIYRKFNTLIKNYLSNLEKVDLAISICSVGINTSPYDICIWSPSSHDSNNIMEFPIHKL